MEFQNILFRVEGPVGIITLNRPEARNALNDQVRTELLAALESAAESREVGGIIITGGEEVFCAGADIRAMARAGSVDMLFQKGTRRIVEYIESLPKPVLAAVGGYALGGGCELALACDVRVASEKAVFGLPEIRLGIIPGGGGTQRLSRLVGAGRAKDIIFSGRLVEAGEAYRIGLAEEIVPQGDLLAAAMTRMKSYLRHGAVALSAAKHSINTGLNIDLRSGDLLEKLSFSLMFSTEDQKEGMQAFLEKRKPEFKGK